MEKWALVTGASGDIGKEIARMLARKGYSLYLHFNKDEVTINDLIAELPTRSIPIRANFALSEAEDAILEAMPYAPECIVHNAGSTYYGLFTEMDDNDIKKMIHQQVTTPTLLTKKLVKSMISQKRGHVIFVTSIWGQIGASCEVVYSMVKGAQTTFVKALAKELAPSGIYVNGVAPGAIHTKMLESFSEAEIDQIKEEIPMARLGIPKEVADAIGFLISSEASYLNGQMLSLNGGLHTP